MKNLKFNLTLVLITVLLICQSLSFADSECPMSEWYPNMSVPPNFTGGYFKPHRTDSAEGQLLPLTASMNVIIVFVQFPDEDPLTNNSEWPIGQAPTYMNNLLSSARKNSGAFWNRYNETSELLSDYYQEVSRGQFHMTGIVKHYIFNHNRSWYSNNATTMNNEIYARLRADLTISWPNYDKWTYLSAGNFKYQGDGNLDMLMMVRRTNPGDAGFAGLDGANFEIDPVNHIWIRTGFYSSGSGTVQQGNLGNPVQPHPYNRFLGILLHEYGHFLFGPHSTIGLMTSRGGNSINDLYYSPFEKLKLGYLKDTVVDFNNNWNYSIGDISSRTSNKNVLKVPIASNEYFLIENRRKISKYDVKMIGDTAQTDMFRNTLGYGKGIYIYHHRSTDFTYPGDQDQECADGLWNWAVIGTAIPDWSLSGTLPLLKRVSLANPVNNDNGYWENLNNKDGISANYIGGGGVYFSLGKVNESVGLSGTDKVYTNTPGYWTSRELWGDRLDAWNVGYNEIFSPYSNPNTKDWSNNNTGIFIYYQSQTNENANLKIYKAGQGLTEDVILAVTPPSRPMEVTMGEYYVPNSPYCRPKILWNHNTEPDMIRTGNVKRYKIYRASNTNMNLIPTSYSLLATVDVPVSSSPEYIDGTIYKYDCSLYDQMPRGTPIPLRYYVKAVDKFDYLSVPSDFVQATGIYSGIEAAGADNFPISSDIPKEFSLSQNFPNPFNPVTRISYDLPFDNSVLINIYDITGRVVMTLVNENKTAGRYEVTFDGQNFASGIYYYKIESGNFSRVRKMILIK